MSDWKTYLETNQKRFEQELLEFLRFPSISSLPENAPDVQRAGEWVAARMKQAGIENVKILPTGGHPIVYGDWLHAPGEQTVMIYGHFDTQPVDPLNLWESPPFEPRVWMGIASMRGATDDKGNMFAPILATEALLKTAGRLPVNVKFFFEGQEEIGSPQAPAFVRQHKEKLACDMVISADGGQFSETEPALSVAFKGICALQIDVVGARRDLHSGAYGGAVANPIHALSYLLASMRSPDGKIMVEGFFDDVVPLNDADRKLIGAVPHNDAEYKEHVGVAELYGEPGYSTLERAWARPTLEVNGIWGGFQGEGVKTVLPNEAHAKITCRLVADQNPDRIIDVIEEHVKQHAPSGVKVSVRRLGSHAHPYSMPADHPGNEAARRVHLELYGREPYYTRSGGSIPVTGMFLETLGVYTVNFAFGLRDENVHAPNEFFRFSSFRKSQTGYCMLLEELAR